MTEINFWFDENDLSPVMSLDSRSLKSRKFNGQSRDKKFNIDCHLRYLPNADAQIKNYYFRVGNIA